MLSSASQVGTVTQGPGVPDHQVLDIGMLRQFALWEKAGVVWQCGFRLCVYVCVCVCVCVCVVSSLKKDGKRGGWGRQTTAPPTQSKMLNSAMTCSVCTT